MPKTAKKGKISTFNFLQVSQKFHFANCDKRRIKLDFPVEVQGCKLHSKNSIKNAIFTKK